MMKMEFKGCIRTKKVVILMVLVTILLLTQYTSYAEKSISGLKLVDNYDLWIDGVKIELNNNQRPIIDENNRTLIPLRIISEQMGYEVKWNANEKSVSIYNGKYGLNIYGERIDSHVKFFIGKKYLEVHGLREDLPVGPMTMSLDTAPQIVNDLAMVPLRFIFSNLNGGQYGVAYEFSNNRHRVFVKSIPNTSLVEDWDANATEAFKKFKEQNNIK